MNVKTGKGTAFSRAGWCAGNVRALAPEVVCLRSKKGQPSGAKARLHRPALRHDCVPFPNSASFPTYFNQYVENALDFKPSVFRSTT
jgi:hypothetical protein